MISDDLRVRRATEADIPAVVALAGRALGWGEDDRNARLFEWKHLKGPSGPSPMWVAEVDGELAGIRALMRWVWRRPDGGTVRAVRTVDTATDPRFQGRGIFRALTELAVDELTREGVAFVFNTPNDQSRPGYLRMGWRVAGRVPLAIRPRSPGALARMARARVPADKWSLAVDAGVPAAEAFADAEQVQSLLGALGSTGALVTDRSPAFLRWRYGLADLGYRAVVPTGCVVDGVAVFRVRRRGEATEATVCDVLVPRAGTLSNRDLLDAVADETGADYLATVGAGPVTAARRHLVPLPRQGPLLTTRALAWVTAPGLHHFAFTLGDIELF